LGFPEGLSIRPIAWGRLSKSHAADISMEGDNNQELISKWRIIVENQDFANLKKGPRMRATDPDESQEMYLGLCLRSIARRTTLTLDQGLHGRVAQDLYGVAMDTWLFLKESRDLL
jgi:hypothetical protein